MFPGNKPYVVNFVKLDFMKESDKSQNTLRYNVG